MQSENLYSIFVNNFTQTICSLTENKQYSNVVILCVGTTKLTGDTFGPIVGHKLKKLFSKMNNINVIGDLENTVHSGNIHCIQQSIKANYSNPFIIAVDSALSSRENIGNIVVSPYGIALGKGIGKNVCYVGNMSIKGVVARDFNIPKYNFKILQNTNLGLIMNMADTVADGIYSSIEYS